MNNQYDTNYFAKVVSEIESTEAQQKTLQKFLDSNGFKPKFLIEPVRSLFSFIKVASVVSDEAPKLS